VLAGKGG